MLLAMFTICSNKIVAQIKTDTIIVGNDSIVLVYPQKSRTRVTRYEEGFFIDLSCIEDEALIELHYGTMINLPLINIPEKYITSEYIVASDLRQTRGFYFVNGEKKYFREDNNYKYHFNIFYLNVTEKNLLLYETFLNSFKYKLGQE